jgi:uridylate kinase
MSTINRQSLDVNYYIISVGGSLIAPHGGVDWKFLKQLRALIVRHVAAGNKFFLVAGGGTTCRDYQAAAAKVTKLQQEDIDWLGVHASRLNAQLLRTVLFDVAHPVIIKDPSKKIVTKQPVIVAGGWKPGWSTDYVAVTLAKTYGARVIINLSNIDYVYNKDPKKYKDAQKITKINWPQFRRLVGDTWTPGLSKPFDPIASKLGAELGLTVIIMNGKKIKNLEKFFQVKKFMGTIIN